MNNAKLAFFLIVGVFCSIQSFAMEDSMAPQPEIVITKFKGKQKSSKRHSRFLAMNNISSQLKTIPQFDGNSIGDYFLWYSEQISNSLSKDATDENDYLAFINLWFKSDKKKLSRLFKKKSNISKRNVLDLFKFEKYPCFNIGNLDKIDVGNVIELKLKNKELRYISPVLVRFCNLEKLDLSKNYLRQLNYKVFPKKLRELDLSTNALKEISNKGRWPKHLRILSFQGNSLSKIPENICSLNHLKDLDLRDNEGVIKVPETLRSSKSLKIHGKVLYYEVEKGKDKNIDRRSKKLEDPQKTPLKRTFSSVEEKQVKEKRRGIRRARSDFGYGRSHTGKGEKP